MYNLFVDPDANSWDGDSQKFAIDRCLRVQYHTDSDLVTRYGSLSPDVIDELRRYPCIFAYEARCNKDPKYGFIKDVVVLRGEVRIEYRIIQLDRFIASSQLYEIRHRLDIRDFELNRTHWAVKNVDLRLKLNSIGVRLPGDPIDIDTHQFDVALSFPGQCREYVEIIAEMTRDKVGHDKCFYDEHYTAQLARPDLDLLLQGIYRDRSKLIVVFLGQDFQNSEWCGIEFRAIREILKTRDPKKVMYLRMDDGPVEGVTVTDGYIDVRQYGPEQIAQFIHQRVRDLA